jgi:HEAT repeat protein
MRSLLSLMVVCSLCAGARANDAAVDALLKQLKDADSDARREAARKIGDLGPDAKKAGPALVNLLKTDKDLFVRRFAAQSLGRIDADPKLAVPVLSGLLKENVKELTEAAVTSLGRMGPAAVVALSEVMQMKSSAGKGDKKTPKGPDSTAYLKSKAAQALGNIGAASKPAVPSLVSALKDPTVRTDAVVALGKIWPGAKDALGALKEIQADKNAKKDKAFNQALRDAIRKIEKG